jgi:DNA mismatch repair protein MutS
MEGAKLSNPEESSYIYFVKNETLNEKTVSNDKETPLMKQYNSFKMKYPDAVLLFRVGDFYETFGSDAVTASRVLGIVLTKRKNGAAASIELAGFPHHSIDTYLPKLVRAGYRVAICDQVEDPKLTKTIVKRDVTELVTPGVSFSDKVLDHRSNNFLAAVHFSKDKMGLAFLDVSTGEFLVSEGSKEQMEKLLQSFEPKEVLYQKQHNAQYQELFGKKYYTYQLDDWAFTRDFGYQSLTRHFETKTLKGFGIEDFNEGLGAAGAALHYLSETQNDKIAHISRIARIEESQYVWLDSFTVRNLELVHSPNENGRTLLDVMDQTISPMGSRMMKRWMVLPLKHKGQIESRLSVVRFLKSNQDYMDEISRQLNKMGDLERMISRVAVGKVSPREVNQLKIALDAMLPLREWCAKSENKELLAIADQLNPCDVIRERIEEEMVEDAPAALGKGDVIATGVSEELDELRGIMNSGKDFLERMRDREAEATGISSLKVAYNNVFGYYLEVTNTHKDKVPETWIRKQTLVNAERYITEELKVYESKILGAEDRILALESSLYQALVQALTDYIQPIQLNAQLVARLDCLVSFARIAIQNEYHCPEIDESTALDIKDGRHPVIELQLPFGEDYVSNDVLLNTNEQQIMMITGPNMSGKSALLRQTALIVLMAQMGSFVPASSAKIGLVDKIFTRVGASDNISHGESTFMVEMNETASILNNVTDRSLVLLDEIGRGTSTYDGISIAWAIAEYLHEQPSSKAKTLFATHYHELNDMTNKFGRIKNFNVSVKELGNRIIFLRKLMPGGSEHSFGIHVARMAGMPPVLIERATQMLKELEKRHGEKQSNGAMAKSDETMQLSFFQLDDPVLSQIRDEIKNIDINTLTPVEALMKLNEIKKISGLN